MKSPQPSVSSLYMSAPYPGKLKYGGMPSGLLAAISLTADRYERALGREELQKLMTVWCEDGIDPTSTNEERMRNLEDRMNAYIDLHNPAIIGVSTFSLSYENALRIHHAAKRKNPKVLTLFGGAHEDNSSSDQRKGVKADIRVAGDGPDVVDYIHRQLEAFPGISPAALKQKILERDEIKRLNGSSAVFLEHKGTTHELHTSGKALHINEFVAPKRYLVSQEKDLATKNFSFLDGMTAQITTRQGCPFSCPFCSEGINKTYVGLGSSRAARGALSIERLEKYIRDLASQGYRSLFDESSTWGQGDAKDIEKALAIYSTHLHGWGAQSTLSMLNRLSTLGLDDQLRKSRWKYVYVGAENFEGGLADTFALKKNKVDIIPVFDFLKSLDVSVGVSLTFGHPDPKNKDYSTSETKKSIQYTIDQMAELERRYENISIISLNIITFHPGTLISQYAKKAGYQLDFTKQAYKGPPWDRFEEGSGIHARGMTTELAQYLLDYAVARLPKGKLAI